MAHLEITKENFEQEVLKASKPVLVDFWASWCMPCRMLAPVIDEIADEVGGSAIIGKVNVDEQGELALKFGINSIPTVLVFKNGQIAGSAVGVRPKAELLNMIK